MIPSEWKNTRIHEQKIHNSNPRAIEREKLNLIDNQNSMNKQGYNDLKQTQNQSTNLSRILKENKRKTKQFGVQIESEN